MFGRFDPFPNAFESITSSFPFRRRDWVRPLRTWATHISPAGLRKNAENVSALIISMPMPTDATQVRALMGGDTYFRKYLPD